jgi:uncharacterized membrane protein
MKLLGHPIHVMLIHFPAALFPMELVCYFIYLQTGNISFGHASFYAMAGGSLIGWLAIVTGAVDLIILKGQGPLQAKALIHGSINSTVVLTYTILAYVAYNKYPTLPVATITMLVVRAITNLLMIGGNYLGGNLVLKYKIGVRSS